MSGIEIGATRPVGALRVQSVEATPQVAPTETHDGGTPATGSAPAAAIATSDAVKAGEPPIDSERVAKIRHAIETGTYPVIPTTIADAMIAAGMLLRNPK